MSPKRIVATIFYAALVNLFALISSSSIADASSAASEPALSIDTPVLELLQSLAAKQILEKHLPTLVKALEENYDVADFLGSSSLKELSIDDDHVVGFDNELLATLRDELSATQTE
ncbi:MAG: hypothetical protein ACI8XU_000990 [Kiritimatiellia bacterium]|jgi:hypothetical protein